MFSCMFHVSPKGTVEENFEVLSNNLSKLLSFTDLIYSALKKCFFFLGSK